MADGLRYRREVKASGQVLFVVDPLGEYRRVSRVVGDGRDRLVSDDAGQLMYRDGDDQPIQLREDPEVDAQGTLDATPDDTSDSVADERGDRRAVSSGRDPGIDPETGEPIPVPPHMVGPQLSGMRPPLPPVDVNTDPDVGKMLGEVVTAQVMRRNQLRTMADQSYLVNDDGSFASVAPSDMAHTKIRLGDPTRPLGLLPSYVQNLANRGYVPQSDESGRAMPMPDDLRAPLGYQSALQMGYKASPVEAVRLQRALRLGGFREGTPNWGVWDSEDQEALQAAITETVLAAENGRPATLEGVIANRARTGIERTKAEIRARALANRGGGGSTRVVETTDPAAIEAKAHEVGLKLLGRQLQPDEAAAVASVISAEETAHISAIAAQEGGGGYPGEIDPEIENLLALLDGDPTEMAGPGIIAGGGPDSTAIQTGKALAARYGLVVTRDFDPAAAGATSSLDRAHADGLAVTVTGDPERVKLLHKWATEITDDEGAQTAMGWQGAVKSAYMNRGGNTLTLVFREGYRMPEEATNYAAPLSTLDSFLNTVKRNEGGESYRWQRDGDARRGAYRMRPGLAAQAAQDLGIQAPREGQVDTNTQDNLARYAAQSLFNRYNDWTKVALHWLGGDDFVKMWDGANAAIFFGPQGDTPFALEAQVNARIAKELLEKQVSGLMSQMGWHQAGASEQSLDQQLAAAAAELGNVSAQGGGSGGTTTVVQQGYDVGARTFFETWKRNAPEAQAFGALEQIDRFRRMLTTPGGVVG